ncbi:MAG: energy transducer TonB [Caulobacterales bacterium]|nr:energy transducer TonB [Caulobacterales bacterium]
MLAIGLLFAAAVAGGSPADAKGETHAADWAARPAARDVRHYPPLAVALRLNGWALLSCPVDASGAAGGCETLSEAPAGLGFGLAAKSASASFRFKPATTAGAPTLSVVRVPIRFAIAPAPPPATADPPSADASSTAVAVAMLSANGWSESLRQGQEEWLLALAQRAPNADPGVVAEARQRLKASFDADRAPMTSEVAAGYARLMAKPDLVAALNYYRTPAGTAFQAHRRDIARLLAAASLDHIRVSLLQARAQICASSQPCGIGPLPSAWTSELPSPPAVDAERLAIAREILLVDQAMSDLSRIEQRTVDQLGGLALGGNASLAAFKAAFLEAAERHRQAVVDDSAARYASLFTAEQLRAILEFKRGPTWRSLQLHREDLEQLGRRTAEAHNDQARAIAGQAFCKAHDCAANPPSGDVSELLITLDAGPEQNADRKDR